MSDLKVDPKQKFDNGDKDPEEVAKQVYGYWWQNKAFTPEFIEKKFKQNQDRCIKALEHYNKKDRPLEILVVHGSLRSNNTITAAHELSNSQMLLEKGLESIKDQENINITRVNLVEHNISPCNGCYSTASAMCGFTCDCHPFDPMQDLYPLVLRADVILVSTGVYQSMPSANLANFFQRLIAMDGGFRRDKFRAKDSDFRAKMIELSKSGNFEYAQRLFGKVAAYFISSKDQENPNDKDADYIGTITKVLKKNSEDFGIYHADDNWYAGAAAKWDEDMSHDKSRLNENTKAHDRAKEVVEKTVEYAKSLKENPPTPVAGRKNRT